MMHGLPSARELCEASAGLPLHELMRRHHRHLCNPFAR